MSDYPQLTEASGDILADDKLFRIGAVKLWAEVSDSDILGNPISFNVAVHDISISYGIGGVPSASVLLGVGLPFGPDAADYEQIQASMDSIERGTVVKIKIQIEEQTFDDNDHLGPALPSGTYTLFDGVVGGTNVQTAEDSKDIGLTINLSHRIGLKMSANTTIFGPFPPGSLDMKRTGATYTAQGPDTPALDAEAPDIWGAWVTQTMLWAIDEDNAYINTTDDTELEAFQEYRGQQKKNLEEAFADTEGTLPLRTEGGIDPASSDEIAEHVQKYIIRGAKATNALSLITQLGQDMYFYVMGLSTKLYVFPYWPYRKISEMLALRAGSFVVTNHKDTTLMARGAFLGGMVVAGTPVNNFLAKIPALADLITRAYTGAYKWEGLSSQEKEYVTIDAVRAPTWLYAAYQPTPEGGEPLKREDYPTVKPVHAPGKVETKEKIEAGKPHTRGMLDKFARFMTLEGIMKGDVIDVYTPLRFDITPGKVLRMDQTTLGRKRSVSESEALYGHVHSVMLRISAISKTAGIQAVVTHVHNAKDQGEIEGDEDGPFAYNTSFYSALNELQLVEEDSDA